MTLWVHVRFGSTPYLKHESALNFFLEVCIAIGGPIKKNYSLVQGYKLYVLELIFPKGTQAVYEIYWNTSSRICALG